MCILIGKLHTGIEWEKQLQIMKKLRHQWHIGFLWVIWTRHPIPNIAEVGSVACWLKVSVNSRTKVLFIQEVSEIGVSEIEVIQAHWGVWQLGCWKREKPFRKPPSEHHQSYLKYTEHPTSSTSTSPHSLTSRGIRSSSSCLSCWSCPGSLSWSPCPPAALVLPTGHGGRSFLLQLRQMLHAAVHLQGDAVRSISIWSVSSYWQLWWVGVTAIYWSAITLWPLTGAVNNIDYLNGTWQ